MNQSATCYVHNFPFSAISPAHDVMGCNNLIAFNFAKRYYVTDKERFKGPVEAVNVLVLSKTRQRVMDSIPSRITNPHRNYGRMLTGMGGLLWQTSGSLRVVKLC